MATTTPNFGWSVPTSTDLVKDGATAIETLGDAIDASLVDLKGGTSGQLLSKASGTDMDFTWTSVSAGSQTSIASGSLTGSSVTISSIAGTYRDLKLVIFNFRPTTSDLKLMMRFNGASTNYKSNAGTYSGSVTFADTEMFISTTADGGAASQSLIVVDVPEYANSTAWKIMTYESLVNNETTNTNGAWERDAGLYKSTSAISSITLLPQAGGTFSSGTYVLYGVQ
jgi:hypothetical protein